MPGKKRFAIVAACVAVALMAPQAFCADPQPAAPVVPCDAAPVPGYVEPGKTPEALTWRGIEWKAPACLGEWPSRFRFLIALAGGMGKVDRNEILSRLGAISTTRGVRYFSVTENAWRELIRDASALSGSDPSLRRADFTADEMASGAELFLVEEDNRSSKPIVYRMQTLEATASRIVVETSNVTPIEAFMLTLFPSGTLLTAYVFTRLDSGEWNLYAMSASTDQASKMVSLATASHVNRAQALFKHMAAPSAP